MTPTGALLTRWLALPQTAGCDVDDPRTTALRRQIILDKPFLRKIYEDWYRSIATALPLGNDPILELGSGAGFMRQHIPRLIASDVMPSSVDVIADATRLPFASASLRGIVMTNVLHHIPNVRAFFSEAGRCVRPGGAVVMIEPWVSAWSTLVYRRLHTEPFEPRATSWDVPATGPLSGANVALPWIIFERDRLQFEREFHNWRVSSVEPLMPFRYLVSGGVSLRCLVPNASHGAWRLLERSLEPWMSTWAMFARIVITRTGETRGDSAVLARGSIDEG